MPPKMPVDENFHVDIFILQNPGHYEYYTRAFNTPGDPIIKILYNTNNWES